MKKQLWLISFALLAPSLSYAAVGTLKICHSATIISRADSRSTEVPKGSGFIDMQPNNPDAISHYRILTLADVTIPPKPGCATIRAELTENNTGKPLTAKTRIHLAPQFDNGLNPVTTIVGDFK